jgi:hypothetical protein
MRIGGFESKSIFSSPGKSKICGPNLTFGGVSLVPSLLDDTVGDEVVAPVDGVELPGSAGSADSVAPLGGFEPSGEADPWLLAISTPITLMIATRTGVRKPTTHHDDLGSGGCGSRRGGGSGGDEGGGGKGGVVGGMLSLESPVITTNLDSPSHMRKHPDPSPDSGLRRRGPGG